MSENQETQVAEKEFNPPVVLSSAGGGLALTSFDEMWRMAKVMILSGMMPKGLQKTEAVFVALEMGLEVGLAPMQAVQNIAVINGRPSIWGDAALGLVRGSGLLDWITEKFVGEYPDGSFTAVCIAKRRGEPEPLKREFSVTDAKVADLWSKQGPWKQYPKRMLQMRARSWALRDGFTDVLKGLKVAEEAMDTPTVEMIQGDGGAYEQTGPVDDWEKPFVELCRTLADTGKLPTRATEAEQEKIEKGLLSFIEQTATANNMTREKVITEAMGNLDNFWQALQAWQKKHAKQEQPKASKSGRTPKLETIIKRLAELKAPELFIDAAREALGQATPEELKEIHTGLAGEIPDMVPLEDLVKRADTLPDMDGSQDQQGNLL